MIFDGAQARLLCAPESKDPYPCKKPSYARSKCQLPSANCQPLTAWLLPCSPSPGSTVCYGDGDQNGFRTLLSQPASKIGADLAGSGWAKVHGILRKSLAPVRIP